MAYAGQPSPPSPYKPLQQAAGSTPPSPYAPAALQPTAEPAPAAPKPRPALDLARIIAPLNAIAVPGWAKAGFQPLKPVGIILHHTGSALKTLTAHPHSDWELPTSVLRSGRPDLSGPLCNIGIGWDGSVCLIAGRSGHHAGRGDDRMLQAMFQDVALPDPLPATPPPNKKNTVDGNPRFVGIEISHPGIADVPWPEAVKTSVLYTCLILSQAAGWSAQHTISHQEWAPWRKSDPIDAAGYGTMAALRTKLNSLLEARFIFPSE